MSDDQKDHSMSEESGDEDIALNSDEEVRIIFLTVYELSKPGTIYDYEKALPPYQNIRLKV